MSLPQATDQMTGQCEIIRARLCAKAQTLKKALSIKKEKERGLYEQISHFYSFLSIKIHLCVDILCKTQTIPVQC